MPKLRRQVGDRDALGDLDIRGRLATAAQPLVLGKRGLAAAVDAVGQVERCADVARPE
jgi:hypothetical protein